MKNTHDKFSKTIEITKKPSFPSLSAVPGFPGSVVLSKIKTLTDTRLSLRIRQEKTIDIYDK